MVDNDGNVHLVGHFNKTMDFMEPGNPKPVPPALKTVEPTSKNYDGFIAKYDKTGKLIWVTQVGGENSQKVNTIGLDGAGNLVVSGEFVKGSVTGSPFCTSGPVSVAVPFTTTGTFAGDQKYTVEVINADGSTTAIGEGLAYAVPVTLPASTGTYRLRMVAGTVVSTNTVIVSVAQQPTLILQRTGTGPVCQGTGVTFTAVSDAVDAEYVFMSRTRDGETKSRQTGPRTQYTAYDLEHNEVVYVEVKPANDCGATSTEILVEVTALPTVTLSRTGNTSCGTLSDGSVRFTIAGDALSYTLLRSGVPVPGYVDVPPGQRFDGDRGPRRRVLPGKRKNGGRLYGAEQRSRGPGRRPASSGLPDQRGLRRQHRRIYAQPVVQRHLPLAARQS